MYAKYQSEVNPFAEKSVPDFGVFFKQWEAGGIAINMMFCDGEPIGFQTAYRINGLMLGAASSYAIGACYTEPKYRSVYKMTIIAGKQFASALRSGEVTQVTLALANDKAVKLQRVCAAAVSEISRGFEV
jgi:hypothetical protein